MPRRALSPDDVTGMRAALEAARTAVCNGEVPVGAAILQRSETVASAHNETVARNDPTAHAELLAIHGALATVGTDRLTDSTLYVTLEPCAQCAGAIVRATVGRVVFGAYAPPAGIAGSVGALLMHPKLNHRPEVMGGVMEQECGALLRGFFEQQR